MLSVLYLAFSCLYYIQMCSKIQVFMDTECFVYADTAQMSVLVGIYGLFVHCICVSQSQCFQTSLLLLFFFNVWFLFICLFFEKTSV